MADKKISDLPQISSRSFNADEDYVLVQKDSATSPTFRAHISDATKSAKTSNNITLLGGKKVILDVPTIGHASNRFTPPAANRSRDVYDLSGFGVPRTAAAAYVNFDHNGEGWPALMFNYYNNATTPHAHRFEYWYKRATTINHTLWMPLSDAKLYIQWVWVYYKNVRGQGSCTFYLQGYA